MIKYYLPVLLALSSVAYAHNETQVYQNPTCTNGKCDRQKSHSNEVLSHFIHTDEMSGYACYTYKFNSKQDKSQVLGVLKDPTAPLVQLPTQKNASSKKHKKHRFTKKSSKRAPAARHQAETFKDPVANNKSMKVVEPSAQKAPIEPVEKDVLRSHVGTHAEHSSNTDAKMQPKSVEIINDNMEEAAPVKESAPAEVPSTKEVVSPELTPAPQPHVHAQITNVKISFNELEVAVSEEDATRVKALAESMLANPNLVAKISSFCFDKNSNHAEARRVALQRAIKVRKILIDSGVNPNNVSVSATEDLDLKSNSLEINLKDETPSVESRSKQ